MKKLLIRVLLLAVLLCAVLPVTAWAEQVTESLGRITGYVDSGGCVAATITIDRKGKLCVEHACSASNSINELFEGDVKLTPTSSTKCYWDGDYEYGYMAYYDITPGEYKVRIIPDHYTFTGGKYWLEARLTYDNHTHSFTQKGETVAPTCGYRGYTKYYCSCGEYDKKDFVDSPPHTVVVDPAKAPTCLTTGLTEGAHCKVCGKKTIPQETVSTLPHDPVDGICSMCGDPCGICGEQLKWILRQETGTLDIYGRGEMYDWDSFSATPWSAYRYREILSVEISDGVTYIGNHAFNSCKVLSSVTMADTVTSIGESAFRNCDSLTGIPVSPYVKSVGYAAFSGCVSLTYFEFPYNVTEIGDCMFSGCSSLTGLVFPRGITVINYGMFRDCSSLTEITIPHTVTAIGEEAFQGCSFTEIKIPKAVTSIGRYAFYNCKSLETIHFDGGAPAFDNDAFAYLTATVICYDDREGWTMETMKDYGGRITWKCLHNFETAVTKPTCLERGYTTYTCGCGYVTLDDYVPAKGHSMSGYRCRTCGYTGGKAGDNLQWELSSGGHLTISGTGAMTASPWKNYSTEIITATISEGVTSICDRAFEKCKYLTNVVVADSVSAIGKHAFSMCNRLTSVNIPEGITRIEEDTFGACTSLETVVLPNSLTYIGSEAFVSCENLAGLVIPPNVKTIGSDCFFNGNTKGMGSITFTGDAPSIGSYAFYTGVQWFTAWYPRNNPTYTSSVMKKYGAINIVWQPYDPCDSHSYSGWEVLRQPTCDQDGLKVRSCRGCLNKETEAIPATGHSFGAWKVHKIATTKEPGEERRSCSVCGHYESRELGAIVVPGDFDGNDKATGEDALYLIWHTLYRDVFPLHKAADFNGDNKVTDADAVILLWHSLYPKQYPLQ